MPPATFDVCVTAYVASPHWLFGGIWKVLERRTEQQALSYTVAPRKDLMGPFIRRLWVQYISVVGTFAREWSRP